MKHFRKLFSCMAASAMVMSLASFTGTKVHAENGYTLTISNSDESAFAKGYSFAVYQILKGDVVPGNPKDNDGKRTLSNIKWGESVTPAAKADKDIGSDIKAFAGKLTNESAAETMAKKLANTEGYLSAYKADSTISKDGKSYTFSGLPGGYYLVKDTTNNKGKHDATSGHIVEVVGDTKTLTKKGVPTAIKKVKENEKAVNDETDDGIPDLNVGTKYNDVADYDIGDKVPFELLGTLPADYSRYSTYCYKFTDTMDKSFTLDSNSIKAFFSNDNGGSWTEIKSGFAATDPDKNNSFTVTFSDLKKISGISAASKIKVTFDATLNTQANIGLPGNTNESFLTFTNDANSESYGQTAPDKVIVFTYAIDTTKADSVDNTKTLPDAEFKIKKGNKWLKQTDGLNSWTDSENDATAFKSDANGKFLIRGLDSGRYTFHETKAPDGYNLGDDLTVDLTAATANGQSWDGAAKDALTELKLGTNTQDSDKHGTASQTITNNKGSLLPSTGGIGTKLLYAAGGILVACAAAYVVISKKHSAGK